LSEPSDELRRPRLGGVEVRSLSLPHNHIIPITDASMLLRIHSTTDTPGTLVEALTETEHDAIVEAHAPSEGRVLRIR
jgi:hypothetical protein